jgi:hypothetical protein
MSNEQKRIVRNSLERLELTAQAIKDDSTREKVVEAVEAERKLIKSVFEKPCLRQLT